MADTSTSGCDLVLSLVHGTWPRGLLRDVFLTPFYGVWPKNYGKKLLWFDEGSEFRNRLTTAFGRRGLSIQISSFLWSGANSVRKRDKAARELAEHVRTKQLEHPGATQVVVAHSHGGNVALRALGHLGSTHDEIFIATLATPFVEILPARYSPKGTEPIEFILLSLAAMLASFLVDHVSGLSGVWNIIATALTFLAAFLLLQAWLRRRRTKNAAKADELVSLTSLSPCVRKHPILVIRAIDDEASLSLAAAAIGNRLSMFLAKWSYVLLICLVILLAISGSLFVIEDKLRFKIAFDALMLVLILGSLGVFACLAISLVLLLAPGPFKSAYGRELLLNARGCEINSHSAPDSIERQSELQSASESTPSSWGTVVTLHQTAKVRRGLRHGLYDDPQCAERIAEWIAANRTSHQN